MNIALAQINAHVGSLDKNKTKMVEWTKQAKEQKAEVILFPELAITGYPPEDLLLRPHFLKRARKALDEFSAEIPEGITALVGIPLLVKGDLYNSLAVVRHNKVEGFYHKMFLPNYGVFDEQRYFARGKLAAKIQLGEAELGLSICEDIWVPRGPVTDLALSGCQIILNASASPYHQNKGLDRERMLAQRAKDNLSYIVYTNLVGGQDELVFDGQSVVIDPSGKVVARAKQFEEELLIVSVPVDGAQAARLRDPHSRVLLGTDDRSSVQIPEIIFTGDLVDDEPVKNLVAPVLDPREEAYNALVLGTREYLAKNGFKEIILGLSGGIDSALVALVAVDAIGKENVHCMVMPSTYSSEETQGDAEILAENLGIECKRVPIESLMHGYDAILSPIFGDLPKDVTEENIQARIRGHLLMAMSNKFGWLVLTTGNKSEISTGFFTIAGGDSAGGLAVLGDVPKLLVYELTRWRSDKGNGLVPEDIITRPPSAELSPGQVDTNSLPPYEILDPIIELYVEQDYSKEEIIEMGFAEHHVVRAVKLIDRAEYKRRLLPPVIKITSKAYGRDWRVPLTNGYIN